MTLAEAEGGFEALPHAPLPDEWRPRRRAQPLSTRPERVSRLVGRDREVADAGEALVGGKPVEFCGEAGVGKTALVRYVAREHPESPLLENVITLPAGKSIDDLLYDLYVAFFIPEERHVPEHAERDLALADVEALLIADDLRVPEREVERLLDVLHSAAILVTSRRQRFWEDWMHSTTLEGLTPDDALQLLELQLGRSLQGEERAIAKDVCAALEGFPWHLKRVAALVRRRGLTFAGLRGALEGTGGTAAVRLSEYVVAALTDEQRTALAWLRTLGCPVHERHLALMSELSSVHDVLESLRELGVVQAHSPVWSVVGAEGDEPLAPEDAARLDAALEHLSGWAYERRSRHEELLEDGDLLATALHRGVAARRRPREAMRLARTLEMPLALSGQWARWEEVLRDGLTAADAAHDDRACAAFRNQLGVRALCLGDERTARRELRRAAHLSRRRGDTSALATAEHNLRMAGGRPARWAGRLRPVPTWLGFRDSGGVVTDAGGPGGMTLVRPGRLAAIGFAGAAAVAVAVAVGSVLGPGGGGVSGLSAPSSSPLAQVSQSRAIATSGNAGSVKTVTLERFVSNRSPLPIVIGDVGIPVQGRLVTRAVVSLLVLQGGSKPKNFHVMVRSRDSCRPGRRLAPGENCSVRVRIRLAEQNKKTLRVVVRPDRGGDLDVRFPVPPVGAKIVPEKSSTPTPTATESPSPTATVTPEAPDVDAAPPSLRLTSIQWRATTASVTLTSKDPDLKGVSAFIAGPRGPFRLLNSCPGPLGTNGCKLRIRYSPRVTGKPTARLVFSWGTDRRDHVDLTGQVAAASTRTARVEVTEDATDVTLTNDGQIALNFTQPESPDGVTVRLGTCAAPVAPRDTCTLTVAAESPPGPEGVPVELTTQEGARVALTALPPE